MKKGLFDSTVLYLYHAKSNLEVIKTATYKSEPVASLFPLLGGRLATTMTVNTARISTSRILSVLCGWIGSSSLSPAQCSRFSSIQSFFLLRFLSSLFVGWKRLNFILPGQSLQKHTLLSCGGCPSKRIPRILSRSKSYNQHICKSSHFLPGAFSNQYTQYGTILHNDFPHIEA